MTPSSTRGAVAPDSSNVIARFRVARHGDLLMLPVTIRGAEYPFVLDTGAMGNVLSKSLVDKLAPLPRSHIKYPEGTPTMYQFPQAVLSGTKLSIEGDAAKLDLGQMSRMTGYNVQGVLGMDFLEGRIVEIDFDAGSVAFLKSAPANRTNALPLGRDDYGRPTVQVEIQPGTPIPFLLDTGMSSPGIGELTAPLFDALVTGNRIKLTATAPRVQAEEEAFAARKGEIDVFKFGNVEHRNLRVTSGYDNAIGLRYLSRYKVTLDLDRDRAYFEPGERFQSLPVFDASGMIVCRSDGQTVIENIHPDGPAAAAGLLEGDIITRVNGIEVNQHSLFTLRQALSRPDRNVKLSVKRADEKFECQMTLKDWLSSAR